MAPEEALQRFREQGIHGQSLSESPDEEARVLKAGLSGFINRQAGVQYDPHCNIVFRPPPETSSAVALISGGGSGHEPLHAGFVADGLLDAAVVGGLSASPAVGQIRAAIARIGTARPILWLVKNYSGDVMNFEIAMSYARPSNCQKVLITDDVSITPKPGKGRRGLAGAVFVHKCAGGMVAREPAASLAAVAKTAQAANDALATVGYIQGRNRAPLGELVARMVDDLLNNAHGIEFRPGDEVAMLVNNLGGTSLIELHYVAERARALLLEHGDLRVIRLLCGTFCTALNTDGVTLTLLNFGTAKIGCPNLLIYFDEPVRDCAWWPRDSGLVRDAVVASHSPPSPMPDLAPDKCPIKGRVWLAVIENIVKSLDRSLNELNELDSVAGDGDLGTTLRKGAAALLPAAQRWKNYERPLLRLISDVAETLQLRMGGTIGALAGVYIRSISDSNYRYDSPTPELFWKNRLPYALDRLRQQTSARDGDCTLLDALAPFAKIMGASGSFADALAAAQAGAAATANMVPKYGRAARATPTGRPDAGARAVCVILKAIYDALE